MNRFFLFIFVFVIPFSSGAVNIIENENPVVTGVEIELPQLPLFNNNTAFVNASQFWVTTDLGPLSAVSQISTGDLTNDGTYCATSGGADCVMTGNINLSGTDADLLVNDNFIFFNGGITEFINADSGTIHFGATTNFAFEVSSQPFEMNANRFAPPSTLDNTVNLGRATQQWENIFLGGNILGGGNVNFTGSIRGGLSYCASWVVVPTVFAECGDSVNKGALGFHHYLSQTNGDSLIQGANDISLLINSATQLFLENNELTFDTGGTDIVFDFSNTLGILRITTGVLSADGGFQVQGDSKVGCFGLSLDSCFVFNGSDMVSEAFVGNPNFYFTDYNSVVLNANVTANQNLDVTQNLTVGDNINSTRYELAFDTFIESNSSGCLLLNSGQNSSGDRTLSAICPPAG